MEVGYIGRLIHNEYLPDQPQCRALHDDQGRPDLCQGLCQYRDRSTAAVTGSPNNLGGGNCIGNATAVTPQPFFEAALAGTGYCNGFRQLHPGRGRQRGLNGTGNLRSQNVWSLYSDLDNGGFNFPRSMMNTPLNCPTGYEIGCSGQLTSGVGMNASVGYGNYNALFITLKSQDWHGVTMQSNFTWSKALGTGAEVQATSAATPPDPFNLRTGYGYQAFDRRFIYNLFFVYQPHWYK